MIACDFCDQWFHGQCVGISAAQGKRFESYKCPLCVSREAAPPDFLEHQREEGGAEEENGDAEYEEDGENDDDDDNDDGVEGEEEQAEAKGEDEEKEESGQSGETGEPLQVTDEDVRSFIRKAIEEAGSCSIALLRRSLGIGYRRAKRLHDEVGVANVPAEANPEQTEHRKHTEPQRGFDEEVRHLRSRETRSRSGTSSTLIHKL